MENRLPVDRALVLRYLGWTGGALPPAMEDLVSRCLETAASLAAPRYRYEKFAVDAAGPVLTLGGIPLEGADAKNLLSCCESGYYLACTIGLPLERLIRQKLVTAPDEAVIYDEAGSVLAEALADRAEAEIRRTETCRLTVRFSPGYGDLPLAIQPAILKLLDAPRRLGLSATETLLLTPTKSITAILGVGEEVGRVSTGCASCRLRGACTLQKSGKSCYHPKTTDF